MRAETVRRVVRLGAINVAAVVVLLVAFEGTAGYLMVIRQEVPAEAAERRHVVYDPELGWVNDRNVRLDDVYTPGIGLRTNSQGFRSAADFSPDVPPGKIRLICSGDSFTLGFGVGDRDTWCDILTRIDTRLETINMGQAGYGLDQAYLWYRRDGLALDHQIHVLAFITDDFPRMQVTDFSGTRSRF